MQDDFARYIEPAALALLGEPNERRGNEWRYGNHGSLAIDVEAGTWYDHEQAEGGGVLRLIQREAGAATNKAAVRWLETQGIKQPDAPAAPKERGRIVSTYDYVDENGELVYQVCRMEPKDFRQRRPDGNGWSWSVKGTTPLPYNLPALLAKPSATILIVEGEKDVDALAALGLLATCNSGGANKWPDAIARWFDDRNVVILPDNDDAGRSHADLVAGKLSRNASSVRVLPLPALPPKGDVSDWLAAGGTREQLIELCKAAPVWHAPTEDAAPDQAEPPPAPPPEFDSDPELLAAPFKALGYDDGCYYFLPHRTQQVTPIPTGSMTSTSQMLSLAPLEYWERAYEGKRTGVDWTAAANQCMRWCEAAGTFDANRVRGRGAWFDAGRSVLHLGNRLLVNRQHAALHALDSRYIYPRSPALESGEQAEPLGAAEAAKLLTIAEHMNWSRPIDRSLFVGWLVLAPICGSLSWRPHVWITGQRGAGKSWAMDHIIAPVLGASALVVQANSTEAGIRQQLKHDARPILFDEAEGESVQGRMRMQNVLELARQASSDGLAQIAKGTASGKALTFRVRSMFLLGSINVGLSQAADKSRFTVLSLVKPKSGRDGRDQFERLGQLVNDTLTTAWCAGLRSRIYGMIPTIRANAAVLAKVAAEHIGNQRAGDQIGALLAGAVAASSDARLSVTDAAAYVSAFDWTTEGDERNDSDEFALLSEIMHAQIRIDTAHGPKTRSVAELVQFLSDGQDGDLINEYAIGALVRHGMRVQDGCLLVSESHPEMRRILERSPWAGGWGRILERVPGAGRKSAVRFAGMVHRAVAVPLSAIMADSSAAQA
jgi:putative DNA primase/helicase